jgi:hypothetical protein
LGAFTTASGFRSTAIGDSTTAAGFISTSTGYHTIANGYASLVTGTYNDAIVSPETTLGPSTPLFIVGNGSSVGRSNAMVVRRDGVGIFANSPNTKLDIKGDFAFRQNEISLTDFFNINNNVETDGFSAIRIVGPTANFSITGFRAGVDGKILTIINLTGFNMTISNLSTLSNADNRINTLNGADLVTTGNGSITLQYSTADQRWIVIAFRE